MSAFQQSDDSSSSADDISAEIPGVGRKHRPFTVEQNLLVTVGHAYGDFLMKRQAGFTLVEIAIVLVVIGLLLGGVLKGQELILNSQIRNAISEFNNVASARFAYQDRYRQIPGDDPTADDRWSGASEGDGNRLIDGDWTDTADGDEPGIFWEHLRNDSLVSGPRTGTESRALPRNAFDGDIGVQEGAFGGSATTPAVPGSVICQSRVPGKAAMIIDTRIDDDPGDGSGGATGSLQGQTETTGVAVDARGSAASDYVTNQSYTMCRAL